MLHMMRSTSIVERLKFKFEVGHKNETEKAVHPGTSWTKIGGERNMSLKPEGRNCSTLRTRKRDYLTNQRQVPTIQSVQKTVEVPKVLYIDMVVDIPVDVQRQGVHHSGFTA